jgi:adenylate cyclase
MAGASPAVLTPRQLEVLELMAKGLRNREIADVLEISASTVKRHVSAVIVALDVTNRTEAAVALQELSPDGASSDVPEGRRVPGFGERPAIAVLPFDNLTNDPEQEYLADAIVEDLTTRLAQWRWFPVIARTSTFTYQGRDVNVREVSRELGARYVLEGSVHRSGDRVRVTAQLIDGISGEHVFADRYERTLEDIFELEDEIVERLVVAVAPALGRFEGLRALRREAPDLNAWECLARGSHHLFKPRAEEQRLALPELERAVELDPRRGIAHAALAAFHFLDLVNQTSDDPERTAELTLEAARRAVALEPDDSTAQQMLGWALCLARETGAAIAAFERAVEINPSLVWSYWGLGTVMANVPERRAEAVAHIEKAMRLSPRDPFRCYMLLNLANIRLQEGKVTEAQRCAEESRDLAPDQPHAYPVLAVCHVAMGRLEEARTAVAAMRRVDPTHAPTRTIGLFVGPEALAAFAAALAVAGFEE